MLCPENIKQLEDYFRKEKIFDLLGIKRIGIFGSFARNEKFNDIDLLIDEEVKADTLIMFQQKLEADIKIPVDVVISKYAEPIILHRAKRDLQYANR
ncbi:MAG: nucleotidyltransferase domain-containing protein [Bacteroidetes bacterium]|nr:nucleotidyltransferase domain-containing protein [Bacteroidota bacterium]MBS1590528.1 nucleotidyltransferase domain-containing protein [Bacteroidota bacterium]